MSAPLLPFKTGNRPLLGLQCWSHRLLPVCKGDRSARVLHRIACAPDHTAARRNRSRSQAPTRCGDGPSTRSTRRSQAGGLCPSDYMRAQDSGRIMGRARRAARRQFPRMRRWEECLRAQRIMKKCSQIIHSCLSNSVENPGDRTRVRASAEPDLRTKGRRAYHAAVIVTRWSEVVFQ